MSIQDQVATIRNDGSKTDTQKKSEILSVKAQAFSDAQALIGRTFTRGQVTVSIDPFPGPKTAILAKGQSFAIGPNGEIAVYLTVTRGAKSFSDEFVFVNPPVLVPDGTTSQATALTGKTINIPNSKEDVVEAFKQMVIAAIKSHP